MRGKPRRTAAVACAKRILDGERAAYNRQGGAAAAVRWAEIEVEARMWKVKMRE